MYPRTNYEMTEVDLAQLLEACKPVPCIMIGGVSPSSPQENANRSWAALGRKLGFDSDTVQPAPGGDMKRFTAVPTETPEQREARVETERLVQLENDIQACKLDIERGQMRLEALQRERTNND